MEEKSAEPKLQQFSKAMESKYLRKVIHLTLFIDREEKIQHNKVMTA